MFAFATEFVSHMPVYFLMFWRAVKHFAAEAAALVSIFLAYHTFIHLISLTFIITNKAHPIKTSDDLLGISFLGFMYTWIIFIKNVAF